MPHPVPGWSFRKWLPVVLLCLLAGVAGCIEGEQSPIRVNSLKFNGVKAVKAGQLKSVLATVGSSKLPWGTKHYFRRDQFDADLKRIAAFYRDRGFPDAKVQSFDVKMNAKQDAVDVTITIDEGQPLIVEAIEYDGFDVLPPGHFSELKNRLALKEKAPLDRALAQASREAALDEIKDHGFPYATVRLTDRQGSNDHARILTIAATPGNLARYGEVTVDGNTSVSDNVVKRQLTFRPGWRYRLSQLQESQRRLYGLETFNFANVEAQIPEGAQPELVPVKVTVTEGKHRKVNFGVGYGSEEKGRVSADWRHVNFFGGARTLQLQGGYSALSKGGTANFRQPYVFGPRNNLTLTAQSWHRNEPAYTLNTNGGRVSLQRTFGRRGPFSQRTADSSLSLTYVDEFQSYQVSDEALHTPSFLKILISLGLDPLNGRARGTLGSLALDYNRATTDSALNATRGYALNGHFEEAAKGLGGDFEFTESIVEGRYYVALGRRAVIAAKLRGGSIGSFADQNLGVPFYRRYFLGGANSLRGWGRFEVSPLFEGLSIGGHTMVESSLEFRVPIWGNLTGVAFGDAGNVWNNAWDFNLNDLRYDIGPGLRYITPIGPIRVDLGYQLNPIPGLLIDGKPQSRRFRFHFSIGQAF
jgi:outer membrane protein assembly complex protein YaeT